MNDYEIFDKIEKYTSRNIIPIIKKILIIIFSIFFTLKSCIAIYFSFILATEHYKVYYFILYIFICISVLIFLLFLKSSKCSSIIVLKEKFEKITFTDLYYTIISYMVFGLISFIIIIPIFIILNFIPKNKTSELKYAVPITIIIIFTELLFFWLMRVWGIIFATVILIKAYNNIINLSNTLKSIKYTALQINVQKKNL